MQYLRMRMSTIFYNFSQPATFLIGEVAIIKIGIINTFPNSRNSISVS
jgi:hypothetical protein